MPSRAGPAGTAVAFRPSPGNRFPEHGLFPSAFSEGMGLAVPFARRRPGARLSVQKGNGSLARGGMPFHLLYGIRLFFARWAGVAAIVRAG